MKENNIPKRKNHCPIILLHGFLGFGRDEGLGIRYWGGLQDMQEILRKDGYEVYTASVGPVSSNWDRACELYACIKGGRVDYGAAHSKKYGHQRFGRSYPGLYPEWGEKDKKTGRVKKVHILAHSQGGQTARMLVQLLEAGFPGEKKKSKGGFSPLFKGGKRWVSGLMTVSSPHDGTTLASQFKYDNPVFRKFLSNLIFLVKKPVYDFKLEHWGLVRKKGEPALDYIDRIFSDRNWYFTDDGCFYDTKPEGAAAMNRWVAARPDVYYFSWSTMDTKDKKGWQVPGFWMNPFIRRSARLIGSYMQKGNGLVAVDSRWFENDGVVNTISMNGPKINSKDKIIKYNGRPRPGVWNDMGRIGSTDHIDIIGFKTLPWYRPDGFKSLTGWYRYNAALLASLPERD